MEDLTKKQHFSRRLKFLVEMETKNANFYNIANFNFDGMKNDEKVINAQQKIQNFISKDRNVDNHNEIFFLLHNIQNKSVDFGLGNVFSIYEKTLFQEPFHFTKSMVFLFQEANFDSLDLTIYGKGDFYYTDCDIANGDLFINQMNHITYGNNSLRSAIKQGNKYVYKNVKPDETEINENTPNYFKCFTRDGNWYSCYEPSSFKDEVINEQSGGVISNRQMIIKKYEKAQLNLLFQSLENQKYENKIKRLMGFYKQVYTTSLVEKRIILIFNRLRFIMSNIYNKTSMEKTQYIYVNVLKDINQIMSSMEKKDIEHYQTKNPVIQNYVSALAKEENHHLLKNKFPEIFKFLDDIVKSIYNVRTRLQFRHFLIQHKKFLNPLIDLIYEIENYKKSQNKMPNATDIIQDLFTEHLITSVFNHPQFRMTKFNYTSKEFKGKIMVHDITDYIIDGLLKKNINRETQTKNKKTFLSGGNREGKWKEEWDKANRRMFAISCDERMNIDKNEINTKQLCTIVSSDYFDPRKKSQNSHVLLIGLGVSGASLNHVALVLANQDFTEVVINVHFESGGQGAKEDKSGHKYAIAELNVLLNNIIGINVHPFFKEHKNSIKNIRIFGDFNLTSNVIAEHLMGFKINKEYNEFKFKLLLDRIKTHDNVGVKREKDMVETFIPSSKNSHEERQGCIDNVIYITKQSKTKLEGVFIGMRKIPENQYIKAQYDSLSDHSPVMIIEDKVMNRSDSSDMSLNSSQSLNSLNSFREEGSQLSQSEKEFGLKRKRTLSRSSESSLIQKNKTKKV